MLKLVINNPPPLPSRTPRPPTHACLVGDPDDPDIFTWGDALDSGLPILLHAGEINDFV